MTEFTSGIFQAANKVYENNRGSILRTIVYTIGHFAIAIIVLKIVADVSFMVAFSNCPPEGPSRRTFRMYQRSWVIGKPMP